MSVLTVRGVDEQLSATLKAEASKRKTSVNSLVVLLLKEAVGLSEPGYTEPQIYHDLDGFIGSLAPEEADELSRVIEEGCERIDEDEWR